MLTRKSLLALWLREMEARNWDADWAAQLSNMLDAHDAL